MIQTKFGLKMSQCEIFRFEDLWVMKTQMMKCGKELRFSWVKDHFIFYGRTFSLFSRNHDKFKWWKRKLALFNFILAKIKIGDFKDKFVLYSKIGRIYTILRQLKWGKIRLTYI